ncbi:molybdenum cofactor guanylyltransferase [Sphingomonas aracearum]|uniref:Molybdenum cofactor guanylyltransferase n=1 Tax=Sphingomonas aracearum TaxID=2283317 RepID=A0A369W2L9_9SPHN|nr:molybdenum cofactor guanylyltransferase [Sphingomonas aracearum]
MLGAILAGGEARRFGGDKAAAMLEGRPLIEHVADALAPHVAKVVVVGRPWPGLPAIDDPPGVRQGPLGGLLAALRHARDHGYRAVLSAPCDTPRLSPHLLAQVAGTSCAWVRPLPVLGLWPAALADRLGEHLRVDTRLSMRGWATAIGAAAIDWEEGIANVNRPADLHLLQPATGQVHEGSPPKEICR